MNSKLRIPLCWKDTCWISLSADDSVAVLDTTGKRELAYLAVGDHPQRIRHGVIPRSLLR